MQIGEVASFQNGYAFKSKDFVQDGKYKIIKIKELKDGKVRFFNDSASVNIDDERIIEKYIVEKEDVLFALTGDPVNKNNPLSWVGRVSVYEDDQLAVLNQRVCKLVPKEGLNAKYIYYYFRIFNNFYALASIAKGSASQANISTKDIEAMEIALPSLNIQNKIVSVLDSIEEKINQNNKINKNLEQQADTIYQSFFSPKSGIQGKRVTLDEYCSIFTGKKNANASVDGGKYKFFTCAPDALQIDSYIYDGNAIIISGNGAYTGRTRFYSGRFDLYQRTYACTLLDGINPDYIFPLYWFVKLELSKKIMGGTRGSAIPYIVMNDLAKFEFIYSDEMFDTYVPIFKSLTESIHVNELENEHLSNLRDTLLPQLMSGELDVSDINL